jgi:hypothetical protein
MEIQCVFCDVGTKFLNVKSTFCFAGHSRGAELSRKHEESEAMLYGR